MSLPPPVAQGARRLPRNNELCGCLTTGQSRHRLLPLHESEVYTTIISGTFKTVLKQTFVNSVSLKDGQHCVYRFPIYDSISVVGFRCKIGSKYLYGLVKGKKQTEAIFDDAVARSNTTGILAQRPEESNLFVTRIGHVPAGERVLIEITYIGELKQDVDDIHFTIPTWIAPHYGFNSPAKHPSAAESVTSPADHVPAGIKITVDIILPETQSIKGIESPSHTISVSMGILSTGTQEIPTMNRASIILSHVTTGLEKDFILAIQSNNIGTPYALLETHPTMPNHKALIVSLIPQFSPQNSLFSSPPEIVFVIDRSGHMRDEIPMLISALKVFLKSLPTNIKFNIYSFGKKDDFLWPQSKDYNSKTLQEAIRHVAVFDSSYGRTETCKSIQATIENRLSEMPLEIILFTSASIRNETSLFAYISEQLEKAQESIRISCVGIGNAAVRSRIERISRAGNGLSQCVQSGGRLDASVVHMLRRALSPRIENATLTVKYNEDDEFVLVDKVTDKMKALSSEHEESNISSSPVPGIKNKSTDALENYYPQIIRAPHRMPSLFAGFRTTIYLLVCSRIIQGNPASITLRSSSSDGSPNFEIPIQVLTEKSTTIHQIAARKVMEDLEESRGWMYNQTTSETQTLAEKEAVRLGETFQIINKWCSFVAVISSDKDILIKGAFPPNLEGVAASSIIIPKTLRPPETKSDPAVIAALYAAQRDSNMSRRAIGTKSKRVQVPPSSASPRHRSIPNNTETRSLSGAKATVLPTAANVHVPVASSSSNTTKVLALIDLQSFDGSWDANSEILSSILESEIPKPGPSQVMDDIIWITMLVIKFLEDSIPEEKGVWCLVVEKARRYVRAHLDTAGDVTSLEEMSGAAVWAT